MAEQASSSIVMRADKAAIMDVIADFPSYPEWSHFMKKVEILDPAGPDGRAKQVRFTIDAGVLKDTYTLDYDWSGNDQVSWVMVEGKALKSQHGSYTLADEGEGLTQVTYLLAVELNMPMLGMFRRKAEKVIIDTALKELKKRVER
jgi:hypothetical protein